jgi:serine/threonine protein kinase
MSTDKNNIFKVVRQRDALNEIAFSAKMSAHKNILKVVGCCLETPIPIVVFEPCKKGTLRSRIFGSDSNTFTPHHQTMAWLRKLKVATQIANAIAYIHTGFSTPIIHMLIDPSNIFFDQKDVPKLSGFSYSVSIPEGETQVKSCLFRKLLTEKHDVLLFGVLLLVLLTGKRAWDLSRGKED